MAGLVVEEEVGFELAQELALGQSAQEHRLVDLDVPVHQRADRAFVGRRTARGDERGADPHAVARLVLQPLQRFEQRLERAGGERCFGLGALVGLERIEPAALVHLFGFVGEQHRIAVERNPYLVGMCARRARRVRVDARRRHTGRERRAHVGLVGREEQVRVQRPQVAPRRLAAREHAALDRQAVVLRRAEHAHARHRVVARQDHHLDPLAARARLVEREQLVDQRERHPRARRTLEPLELELHVGAVVRGFEDPVLFFEVEQGARGDGDDQLAVERRGHAIDDSHCNR